MMSHGQQLLHIVRSVGDIPLNEDYFRARSSGRFIEEAVELGLQCGLTATMILGHVIDALHNEAKKAKIYPSQLMGSERLSPEVIVELGDNEILLDYLRHLYGISRHSLELQKDKKVKLLSEKAEAGEMILIEGLMYRRESRA